MSRESWIQSVSFGCRLNAYESEVMEDHARRAGIGDAIIVNTCAVTAQAERQAKQKIRSLKRSRPEASLIVSGCSCEINRQDYAAMPQVDHIIKNSDKLNPAVFHALAPAGASPLPARRSTRSRALLYVQQGCDHRCTFCIIPYARGASVSIPIETVCDKAARLVQDEIKEIVLTGVDLTSYGRDLPDRPSLGELVRRVLESNPTLPRLRLSSLDPAAIDQTLWDAIRDEPRLMPHLHLSLQAGDDMVLKRMKRRHRREDAIEVCRRARSLRPDIALGADLIAGFPTESEEQFLNTLDLIEHCSLTWLHIFPYSSRPGTPAARMPEVPIPLRKERASRLRDAARDAASRYLKQYLYQSIEVLIETPRQGRSKHFASVSFDQPQAPGALIQAFISQTSSDSLTGSRL